MLDYASPDASAKRVTNGWAALGCMLGIGFLLPPVALAGAIASWIGLRRSADPHVGRRRAALIGLWLGSIGLALLPVDVITLRWAREKADAIKCQSQISAIAQCVFMYANNNRDQLPPDLPMMAAEQDVSPAVFACVGSSDTPAASLAGIPAPGHLSYVYLRPGQHVADIENPGSTLMLYEQPNHFGGMNVAFYDGHVEFVARAKAAKVIAELQAGQNPPPSLAAR